MARRLATLIALSLALLQLASAQARPETVSVTFRIYGVGQDHFEGLFFFDGDTYQTLELNKTSRSTNAYEYRGPPRLSIHAENPNYRLGEPSELRYVELATIPLDQSYEEALLILVANTDNREGPGDERRYQTFLIDDSISAFGRNAIMILNATGADLYGKVADSTLLLPRGESEKIDYTGLVNQGKRVPVAFALNTKNGPRMVMANEIPLPSNRRVVAVLLPPERKNSLRIEVRALMDSNLNP